ncbi:MAG: cysteine desulfurase, partial [Chloroflexi bacterium]|nr:cysteine desulfurase [Chloroflexota bacterium]
GLHWMSEEATRDYEESREKVRRFLDAAEVREILFVRGTTEAINLVSYTWAETAIGPGDEILSTEMEHHSNLVPWQRVARQQGALLRHIPITPQGTLDLSQLDSLLGPRTKLVAVSHMSNVLGTINPVKEIARRAHASGARVLLDAAQSVPHLSIDVKDLDCDFLAFSGHKMLGPTGIGALYVRPEVLETMEPFHRGGEMVREVWLDRATWNDLPNRFEAGTPNIADAIALGAAVDYLQSLGMDHVRQHEIELTRYALEQFRKLEEKEDVQCFGPKDLGIRGGIVSFYCPAIHPHDLGTLLDREGIAIRAGHHCAMPLMRALGVPATARASFYLYNTQEEVDLLVEALKKAIHYFVATGQKGRRAP